MKRTSLGELIANAVSHGVGALLSILVLILLLIHSDSTVELLSSLAFGIGLIVLYFSSTLYHSFPDKMKRTLGVFKRLDHASIYVLISGSYTPFILLGTNTSKGYWLLGVLWFITIVGVVLKSIWIKRYHVIHVILYVLMGWSVLLVWSEIQPHLGQSLVWLIAGGVSYTLGVGFYASKFKYSHFVWHIFVLFGSISHFIAVWLLMS
jgi:hemolysin III